MITEKRGFVSFFMSVVFIIVGALLLQEDSNLPVVLGALICASELLQFAMVFLFELGVIKNVIKGEHIYTILVVGEMCCIITAMWLDGFYSVLDFVMALVAAWTSYLYVNRFQYIFKKYSIIKKNI